MKDNLKILSNAKKVNELAENLSKCKKVTRYNTKQYREEWNLAIDFADLEESFHDFLYVHLPKLFVGNLTEEQVEDVLFDIGDEFRHIIYHLYNNKFFENYVDKDQFN